MGRLLLGVGRHDADIGQVTVALGVVHSIPDDEEVGNGEAYVVCFDFFDAAGGLVEEGGDAEGLWVLLEEELAQIGECEAGIENVFDDEYVFPLDGVVKVFDELDCAGGPLSLAITGGGDKVEGGIDLDGSGQVGEKGRCAFQNADHDEPFALEILGDLSAHFGDALGDLLTGEKDF